MSTQLTNSFPLNLFQRLVRSWERVHPYNAAQAMKVRGLIDPAAAQRAWCEALHASGLARHRPAGQDDPEEPTRRGSCHALAVLPSAACLSGHLSEELNRPFDDAAESPYRPFIAHCEDASYLGVVYQHWVADSVAIRLLLREWFMRLFDPASARATPLAQPKSGYWQLFGPGRPGWRTVEMGLSLFRRHMRYRRARKVRTFGASDYPVRVILRQAPEGLIDRLVARARSQGLKVNDIFLAAAAETCNRFVPTQRRKSRRDLAVGSIVDLRPYAGTDLSDTFGLFLGFTEVVCRPSELRDFDKLVKSVGVQNRQHRRDGIAQSSLGWMLAAAAVGRFVAADDVYHFYRKETPLAGGVSNVNLNATWAARRHPTPLLQYLRVSPTGPMVPMVFTLTTLGSRLDLSLTYRPALLDESQASAAAAAFLQRLAMAAS